MKLFLFITTAYAKTLDYGGISLTANTGVRIWAPDRIWADNIRARIFHAKYPQYTWPEVIVKQVPGRTAEYKEPYFEQPGDYVTYQEPDWAIS